MANPVGSKYKSSEVAKYLQKALIRKNYFTFAVFAKDFGLRDFMLQKYIRCETRFDLHYFMALVEGLDLDASEFYGVIYKEHKKKGLL